MVPATARTRSLYEPQVEFVVGDGTSESWHTGGIDTVTSEQIPENDPFLVSYLPYLLHRADALMSAPFHTSLADEGIQLSEWRVLAVLNSYGSRSISALAVDTKLPQPTVTHTVARLEERGHVRRRVSASDRRQRIVELTSSGADVVIDLIEIARRSERALLVGLGRTAVDLRAILQHVIALLEAKAQEPMK